MALEVVVDGDVNGPFARRARHRVLGGEKPAPLPPGRYGVGVETRLGFTSPPAIDVR